MSNRNHAWRLEDENGNKMGEAPSLGGNVTMYLNGKEVAQMQSISFERIKSRVYEIGDNTPISFSGSIELESPIVTREINAEVEFIIQECHRETRLYQYRYGCLPAFLSMSEQGYQSYYIKVRELYPHEDEYISEQYFMGVPIICHPTQEEDVKALGTAVQVGLQGRGFLND